MRFLAGVSDNWRMTLLRCIGKLSWAADEPKRKQYVLHWQMEPKVAEIQGINMGQGCRAFYCSLVFCCMAVPEFLSLLVEGHLSCFQGWVIMNKFSTFVSLLRTIALPMVSVTHSQPWFKYIKWKTPEINLIFKLCAVLSIMMKSYMVLLLSRYKSSLCPSFPTH